MTEILASMKIGFTRVINGKVVTRWSANAYEIGTFGREYYDMEKAASILAK